jgi:hypothetical protein
LPRAPTPGRIAPVVRTATIVYPEGDSREIEHDLAVNQLVDLNGYPLPLPLPSPKMIVYRVWKVSTRADRNTEDVYYHLELVTRPELESAAFGGG